MVLASGKSKQSKINSYCIQKILFITHSGSLLGTFLPQLLQGAHVAHVPFHEHELVEGGVSQHAICRL